MVVQGDGEVVQCFTGRRGIEWAGGEISLGVSRGTERLDAPEDYGGAVFDDRQQAGQLGLVFSRGVLERLRRLAQGVGAKVSGSARDRMRVPGGSGAVACCDRGAQGIEGLALLGKSQQDPLEAATIDLETPHRAANVDAFEHRI